MSSYIRNGIAQFTVVVEHTGAAKIEFRTTQNVVWSRPTEKPLPSLFAPKCLPFLAHPGARGKASFTAVLLVDAPQDRIAPYWESPGGPQSCLATAPSPPREMRRPRG